MVLSKPVRVGYTVLDGASVVSIRNYPGHELIVTTAAGKFSFIGDDYAGAAEAFKDELKLIEDGAAKDAKAKADAVAKANAETAAAEAKAKADAEAAAAKVLVEAQAKVKAAEKAEAHKPEPVLKTAK